MPYLPLLTVALYTLALLSPCALLALAAIWWELRYIRTNRRPAILPQLEPIKKRFL